MSPHRKLTITLEEAGYEGLSRTVGRRRVSQFIEDLVRPHVVETTLEAGYQAMAADTEREAEAQEWCNALAGDGADETRCGVVGGVRFPMLRSRPSFPWSSQGRALCKNVTPYLIRGRHPGPPPPVRPEPFDTS